MSETVLASAPDPSLVSPAVAIASASTSSSRHNNVHLDLRNQKLTIDRDALMELPESILLCLFPNGLVLSQKHHPHPNPDSRTPNQPRSQGSPSSDDHQTSIPQDQDQITQQAPRVGLGAAVDVDGEDQDEEEEEEVYYVDFDGPCLSFILNYFRDARLSYYGTDVRPGEPTSVQSKLPSPLFFRQAIVVLREELEYFVIPSTESPPNDQQPNRLKKLCGDSLLNNRSVFTPLQRNINREKNVAEQHLIDMLCMSGFNRDDEWAYRSLEPRRCCITSLALVLLKTGIKHVHPGGMNMSGPESPNQMNPEIDSIQLTTAQKLLLFWRKPARKCWWDASSLTVKLSDSESWVVKLWARRVWTLELSLI